jgi:hypothetical protein
MRIRFAAIFLVLSASVFGLDLSAGLGMSGGFFFNRFSASNSSLAVSSDLTNTSLPFHAELFFDGQYFRLGAGYRLAVLGHQAQTQTISGTTNTIVDQDMGLKGYLSLSIYAKYPFQVGPFILFPLLGLEKDILLLSLDANWNDVRGTLTSQQLANEDQIWIKGGMGADWAFSRNGYLRAELVLGYKLPSPSENDAVANAKAAGFDATLFTLEPDLAIAIGFKL